MTVKRTFFALPLLALGCAEPLIKPRDSGSDLASSSGFEADDGDPDDSDEDDDDDDDDDDDGPPIEPTWVLRDASGVEVPAFVTPTCGDPESALGRCPPGIPGAKPPYNCVLVSFFEQSYVQIT